MNTFANEQYFSDPQWEDKAKEGIISPIRREIDAGIIFRFGADETKALTGPWWFDQAAWNLIAEFAALNLLPVAHAGRILAAVAHRYSSMVVLRRAQVIQPLLAWEGVSKPQTVDLERPPIRPMANAPLLPNEHLAPPTQVNGKPFLQLFIPGIWDPAVNKAALLPGGLIDYFPEGASHIFGVPGVPAGTIMQ